MRIIFNWILTNGLKGQIRSSTCLISFFFLRKNSKKCCCVVYPFPEKLEIKKKKTFATLQQAPPSFYIFEKENLKKKYINQNDDGRKCVWGSKRVSAALIAVHHLSKRKKKIFPRRSYIIKRHTAEQRKKGKTPNEINCVYHVY